MGFEPTTACLGSKNSTTELRPLSRYSHSMRVLKLSQGNKKGTKTILVFLEFQ